MREWVGADGMRRRAFGPLIGFGQHVTLIERPDGYWLMDFGHPPIKPSRRKVGWRR